MTDEVVKMFYMCPNCMEPAEEPTPCPKCGGNRVPCRPGESDDPCRKPFMAPTGEIRSRAPVWWLQAIGRLKR
jgi:hypothetical protein